MSIYQTPSDANLQTTDITTNDVSTTKHGFTPKAPNDAGKFLDGTGAWTSNWWIELGRTTLGSSNGTVSLASFTAKKYLKIVFWGLATGGTINLAVRFNNDTANNYAIRDSQNGAADATAVSQSAIVLGGTAAQNAFAVAELNNVAANEKLLVWQQIFDGTAGAGNIPNRSEGVGKWANTAAQITRVDVVSGGSGTFNTGSELIVLGHD